MINTIGGDKREELWRCLTSTKFPDKVSGSLSASVVAERRQATQEHDITTKSDDAKTPLSHIRNVDQEDYLPNRGSDTDNVTNLTRSGERLGGGISSLMKANHERKLFGGDCGDIITAGIEL